MKQVINTSDAPQAIGTYSQAVKAGKTVFLSGQIPLDPATGTLVTGDFKQQVRQVLRNLECVAVAAGGSLQQLVKISVYLTDINHYAELNAVMGEFCDEPYPARVVIAVAGLPKNAAVEIAAIMLLGEE